MAVLGSAGNAEEIKNGRPPKGRRPLIKLDIDGSAGSEFDGDGFTGE